MAARIRSAARVFNTLPSAFAPAQSARVAVRCATTAPSDGEVPAIQVDQELRLAAIKLYKELHRLGRDYPDPEYGFNKRLRRIFEKNAKLTSTEALREQLALGEHVKKEVLALISLKKFRHLRRTYHPDDGPR